MTEITAFRALIERHAPPSDRCQPTAIPGVSLMHLVAPARPVRANHDLVFYMVINGSKRVHVGAMQRVLGPGDYIVSNADLDIVSEIAGASDAEPYIGVVVRLDPVIAMATARALRDDSVSPAAGDAGSYIGGCGRDNGLVDATWRLLALLDRAEDIALMAPLLEREIVYRLLRSEVAPAFAGLISLRYREMRIATVIDIISRHYRERLDIHRLARASGLSTSALYREFKAATAMSPGQYQKKIRLREARHFLLDGAGTVTAAALRVGYVSPTQFSREYKRAYGRAPLHDVLHVRSADLQAM